ncbi:hypothetical protein ALC53_09767 [Atta colombica]|uniref:Ubiquitin carboxyl-terminal hydrolase MINDY n=1 Tax=Atta colombica TaxID=520822 RepID=A0A195B6G2_9HYME|nr:hypothetical protein ALC53_09767 [Atta colombica]
MAEPDLTEVKETTVANATSTCDKRHCKEMRKDKLPPYLRDRERILYPRNTRALPKTPVIGGQPIEEETCMTLRKVVFGSCASPPKVEWARTGLTLRPYGQSLAFGLRTPRNTTRGFVTAVQAVMLKHFLFKCDRQDVGPEILLKPSYDRQIEVLTSAISEIIWRCAGGFSVSTCPNIVSSIVPKAIVALPQDTPYLQHSVQYFQDGLTETAYLSTSIPYEKLLYILAFHDEGGPGAKLLLYSAVLSRGLSKIRNDLEDPKASILGGCSEEGPISIIIFVLTGRASSHLHNGVLHVGDENTYAVPQWGVLMRSEVGFLVHESDSNIGKQPGSRLKTPTLPIWVTLCLGHHGVLFNANRELLRNYHAERRNIIHSVYVKRFEVQYFTCGGSHATLTVDTRANETSGGSDAAMETMDIAATPLEKLIRSKWQDAFIQWNGTPIM